MSHKYSHLKISCIAKHAEKISTSGNLNNHELFQVIFECVRIAGNLPIIGYHKLT